MTYTAAELAGMIKLFWAMWNDAYEVGDYSGAAKLLSQITLLEMELERITVTFPVVN